MADKKARAVKTAPTKAAAKGSTKAAAKRAKKPEKGTTLTCEVCGMGVIIDEVGDVFEFEELICHGEPMKVKISAKKKSAAKPKAKAKPAAKAEAAK